MINIPIQYLRGVAAILVIFVHFKILPVFDIFCGAIGVDIFFIISGFIMSNGIAKYNGNKSKFIINRLVRILPLYLLLSIPLFLLAYFQGNLRIIFTSLFFVGGNFTEY